jgi:hypothetical protein
MDQPKRPVNLLILRGVYPRDFVPTEGIFDTAPTRASQPEEPYTSIPRRFTGVATWPQFSNLKCWNCDEPTKGYPKFVALNPEKNAAGEDECDVLGNFHEWNCAASYIIATFPPDRQWELLASLCLFESKFTGKRRAKIMPAPPKTLKKQYCGNRGLTSAQWEARLAALNENYLLSQYKMEHFQGGE